MKKFSKIIVALVMFVTVFAFVGCGTPDWQQVDTINTNANYQTSTYSAISETLNATGDDQLKQQTGLIKVSQKLTEPGVNIEFAGVIDASDEATTVAAFRYTLSADVEDGGSANFVMYVTKDAYYVDGSIDISGLNVTLKNKFSLNNKLSSIASILETAYNGFEELIKKDYEVSVFNEISAVSDKINFEIATDSNGTTKLRASANDTITIDGDTYTDYTVYFAIQNKTLQEFYASAESKDANRLQQMSLKRYTGYMPTFDASAYPEYSLIG